MFVSAVLLPKSCGGAVQGVREISFKDKEEGNYLNRANDGFVFWDDGTYSAGPLNVGDASQDENVCWTSLSLSPQTRVLVQSGACTKDSEENTQVLFLWKDGADPCRVVLQQKTPQEGGWTYQKRCRMPSLSQPWMIQRAKWELSGQEVESKAPFTQPTVWVARDASDNGIDITTGCFCAETGVAVAVRRSYLANGGLTSVTYMHRTI